MSKSSQFDSPTSDTLHYASPPQQAQPSFAWFACGAIALIVVGLLLANAGHVGKYNYDWRAAIGISLVLLGVAIYFAGRSICKRPTSEVS